MLWPFLSILTICESFAPLLYEDHYILRDCKVTEVNLLFIVTQTNLLLKILYFSVSSISIINENIIFWIPLRHNYIGFISEYWNAWINFGLYHHNFALNFKIEVSDIKQWKVTVCIHEKHSNKNTFIFDWPGLFNWWQILLPVT